MELWNIWYVISDTLAIRLKDEKTAYLLPKIGYNATTYGPMISFISLTNKSKYQGVESVSRHGTHLSAFIIEVLHLFSNSFQTELFTLVFIHPSRAQIEGT